MISSFVSITVAGHFGIEPVRFVLKQVPGFTPVPVAKALLLACFCAVISGCFCFLLHRVGRLYQMYFENPYMRIVFGGIVVILLVWITGTRDYNGDGMPIIIDCFTKEVSPFAFLWKMLFTVVTLGAGYKGGEIVPSLFIGATFGFAFGELAGLPPAFAAAIGMVGVFCGVTNCPITSLLLGFEMFGYKGAPYLALVVAISYMLSGYYGLYDSQKIMYSKMKTSFVNRRINNKLH